MFHVVIFSVVKIFFYPLFRLFLLNLFIMLEIIEKYRNFRRVLSHYSALKISPTSEGMVTEDIIRKLHLNVDMNAKLNDVYPSVFKMFLFFAVVITFAFFSVEVSYLVFSSCSQANVAIKLVIESCILKSYAFFSYMRPWLISS